MIWKDRYKDAVCVVTGATSGNGEAVARELVHLGADVHVIGRNYKRMLEWTKVAHVHPTELGNPDSVMSTLRQLPRQVDYLFHLAGNAVLGDVSPEAQKSFLQSDYHGPVTLLDGLCPRMNRGGGVGIVSSASVALHSIPDIQYYQYVKGKMTRWWWNNQDRFLDREVGCTLISMGFINTGIWKRVEGLPRITSQLVRLVMPGPMSYAKMILEDVAYNVPVSYPGVGASLAPLIHGKYQPHPLALEAVTWAAETWFDLFPAHGGSKPGTRP